MVSLTKWIGHVIGRGGVDHDFFKESEGVVMVTNHDVSSLTRMSHVEMSKFIGNVLVEEL